MSATIPVPNKSAVTARTALESGLHEALRDGQFLLHYQAQISQAQGMVGAEALVRWQHPQRGLVSPAEFIPVAEASGLIVPLGDAPALGAALERLARDPSLRQRMGTAARLRVLQGFTEAHVKEVLRGAYLTLLGNGASTAQS